MEEPWAVKLTFGNPRLERFLYVRSFGITNCLKLFIIVNLDMGS